MKIYSKSGVRLCDKSYLQWIRGLSCIWGGIGGLPAGPCFGDVVPAHGPVWARGMKGQDYFTIPMCFHHHNQTHSGKLKVTAEARQKLVNELNKAYCKQTGITMEELRGK